MSTKKKLLYIVACLIIIAGIAVWKIKGFNMELQYSSRNQINIGNNTGINKNDIKQIVSEVLGNTRYVVQEMEIFENAVSITADEITPEQKSQIIQKINEKYNIDIKNDSIDIISIPHTRIKDIIEPFIIPGIIITIVILVYFLIRFKSLSWKKILVKTVIILLMTELLLYSIISITRIPFGRITEACGIGLYVIVIALLSNEFENVREKELEQYKENN